MAYHALYRKYRPSSFSEVIGQEHITSILRNQVRSGRVAHAYLFSGSRGIGKTSTARIFAKAINCLDPKDGEPCGECEACRLSAQDSIDIIEMDAASNSRVDEMRALLDKAEFAPVYLKTKVYIIDEAHMLSKSANNALLKTLEEPPAQVVFILATTEPQALPATILSRCQRFDFRRPSVIEMVGLLKRILADVGASIDEEGMMCIARAADGGVRDCLSIADQCLSFAGNDLSEDDVLSVLGSMNADFLFRFAGSIINSDASAMMKNIDTVVSSGRDIGVFVQDLSAHFRALLLTKVCGECSGILDCTRDMMQMYMEQAASASRERLERTLQALMQLQPNLRWVTMPRVLLESTLLQVCHPEESKEVLALSDRIAELENKLKNGCFVAAESSGAKAEENNTVHDEDAPPWDEESCESEPAQAKTEDIMPQPTQEAEELFRRFMSAVMQSEVLIGVQLQLSSTHWCDEDTLYICFDKKCTNNYNYLINADIKQKLRRIAAESIAPFGIEISLSGSAQGSDSVPDELYGVKIERR